MRVHLLAFGRLKIPGLRDAADYYLRALRPWVSVEEHELKPLAVPEKSAATRSRIQADEGALLLDTLRSRLGERGAFYLLDEGGKSQPTQAWADAVRSWESMSLTGLAFC